MIAQHSNIKDRQHSRELRCFEGLLLAGESRVRVSEIASTLDSSGLRRDDPRLCGLWAAVDGLPNDGTLDENEFLELTRASSLIVEAAVTGSLVIPEFSAFRDDIRAIFDESMTNENGRVADYIPQLGRVNPEQFGLSICSVDGQRASYGDAAVPFSAQCIHKPLSYAIALETSGYEEVHKRIGCEPSGQSFNEITLDRNGRPHNPMLNSGSIMCTALIQPELDVSDRFQKVVDTWQALAGGERPGFDNATYLSERRTADRNSALTYFMREHNAFPDNSDALDALDLYIQSCSAEVTADSISVVASTLAAGGICPLSGERVLQSDTVQKCLSFMYSCGMYDYSGRWAFRIGLPAKSGVSGGVMVIVPNVMGVCIWSPRLDVHGNSVRAIEFCERLVDRYNFHNYDGLAGGTHQKIDPRTRRHAEQRELLVDLCWAASEGDQHGIQRLVVKGADIRAADYDGRTALHLAASEGRADAISKLLELGADASALDRWGNTPLDDALREGHNELTPMLEAN